MLNRFASMAKYLPALSLLFAATGMAAGAEPMTWAPQQTYVVYPGPDGSYVSVPPSAAQGMPQQAGLVRPGLLKKFAKSVKGLFDRPMLRPMPSLDAMGLPAYGTNYHQVAPQVAQTPVILPVSAQSVQPANPTAPPQLSIKAKSYGELKTKLANLTSSQLEKPLRVVVTDSKKNITAGELPREIPSKLDEMSASPIIDLQPVHHEMANARSDDVEELAYPAVTKSETATHAGDRRTARADDFTWIIGKLFRLPAGQWGLRYAAAGDDVLGGYVVLALEQTKDCKDGTLVFATGKLIIHRHSGAGSTDALYQVKEIRLIDQLK